MIGERDDVSIPGCHYHGVIQHVDFKLKWIFPCSILLISDPPVNVVAR